ncbi:MULTISPECIES: DUF1310 family protein [unclassified Enterococcus]|uniref:DUF1310 family protein n=1 Tax=unclassified Enterococcus TaxID=2608891 RepID=UPI001CE0382F|nr:MULTISPECIES: DUF1310 family protein [unclassified Enterococcus]MCA5011565.1 DUF1310 family protein [Enterococcus sp. S23]MCA5014993.1 DUF1310 family protein [Enterococcus sp. S22(2020)]
MNGTEKNDQQVSEIKKIRQKTLVAFLGVFLIIIIGIGGKIYMGNIRFHDEMVNVVKNGQAKEIIEEGLKNLDSKALTSEGIIKSYKIDYESVEHNPMGGINGKLYINSTENLYVTFILDVDSEGNLDRNHGISSYSSELDNMLKERNNG